MPKMPEDPRIKVPTLMMWGMRDFALSHRMARPSIDYVDEGILFFFPKPPIGFSMMWQRK